MRYIVDIDGTICDISMDLILVLVKFIMIALIC